MAVPNMPDDGAKSYLTVKEAINLADSALSELFFVIQGEVSSVSNRKNYKAVYFTLKDDDGKSQINCLIWKNTYEEIGIELKEGMLVKIKGKFSIYAARGELSFKAWGFEPVGEGDLRVKIERLIKKLDAEGLFEPEHKLPIPKYPEKVGVVTSGSGAVIHDIIRTINRRAPYFELDFWGVSVESSEQMGQALLSLDELGLDAIIFGRGGGSFEDFMPFNDEKLVRIIYSMKTPVITGIGHNNDNSICDLVADYCASTPTAAAEKITEGLFELRNQVDSIKTYLADLVTSRIDIQSQYLEKMKLRLNACSPESVLASNKMRFDYNLSRLNSAIAACQKTQASELKNSVARLQALSPMSVFSRGYSCATNSQGHVLSKVEQCEVGESISVMLTDGSLNCEIKSKSSEQTFKDELNTTF
ncbi:MAG: exodeoxyribonuclease VII large subunit [Phoenicibacter congonensis]|uniref:Exodeoxyribonuclease 7 large subunit n=1 Tax=Phoenicibacter congonensis TaxID=1944646 RepID=A0AA43RHG3_9ACTN|nr:exodeoxyribonuclease VII large subunit [Phoenicibacter congonensis]